MARRAASVILCALMIGFASRSTVEADSMDSPIPTGSRQLVLGVAASWRSTTVELRRFERGPDGVWSQVGARTTARIGPKGLRWGRGLHGTALPGSTVALKHEGDGTAPAGAFRLGTVFAYDAAWAKRTAMPFVQVGPNDLFIEDPTSPDYNRHVRLDHPASTPWEIKNRMRLNDPAHRLKVLVEHNTDPQPVTGAGSAIFLHVWRGGGSKVTAGCTAIASDELDRLVAWLRPEREPVYVLLPKSVLDEVAEAWQLPS